MAILKRSSVIPTESSVRFEGRIDATIEGINSIGHRGTTENLQPCSVSPRGPFSPPAGVLDVRVAGPGR